LTGRSLDRSPKVEKKRQEEIRELQSKRDIRWAREPGGGKSKNIREKERIKKGAISVDERKRSCGMDRGIHLAKMKAGGDVSRR